MRKEAGFEVQDRIEFYYCNNDRIAEIINKNKELIAEEILANKVVEDKGIDGSYAKKLNINGENVEFSVKR